MIDRTAVHNLVYTPIPSQQVATVWIAGLSIRKRSASTTSSTGCTLLSILKSPESSILGSI